MIRMVLLLVASVVLGALIGLAVAGPMGMLFGTMFGALVAVASQQLRMSTHAPRPGAPLHHEPHRLLCVPCGRYADVVLTHDEHQWCDVESCSLCEPSDEVGCRKRCLVLMNDAHRPNQEPVSV